MPLVGVNKPFGGSRASTSDRGLVTGVHGLRGFAALAVVMFHSGLVVSDEKYQGIELIGVITAGFANGVDMFFVISGFVISLPLFLERKVAPTRYALNRLLRIYPLAMLTAIIFIGANWIASGQQPGMDTILSSVFLLPSETETVPGVLWTLKQELLFYTLFVLALLRPKAGLILVTAWGIASLLVPMSGVFTRWFFHNNNVQFVLGIAAAWLYVARPLPWRWGLVFFVVGLLAFSYVAYAWPHQYDTFGIRPQADSWNSHIKPLLLAAAGLVLVYGAASWQPRLSALVMLFGTASYSIYLIHYLFVSAGNRALYSLAPETAGAVVLLFLFTFGAVGGIAYYQLAERNIEVWRKSLMNYRKMRSA